MRSKRKSGRHASENWHGRRSLHVESLEPRALLNVDWRNPVDALDVSGDGAVVALDALLIINAISNRQSALLPDTRDPGSPFVDGDTYAKVFPPRAR